VFAWRRLSFCGTKRLVMVMRICVRPRRIMDTWVQFVEQLSARFPIIWNPNIKPKSCLQRNFCSAMPQIKVKFHFSCQFRSVQSFMWSTIGWSFKCLIAAHFSNLLTYHISQNISYLLYKFDLLMSRVETIWNLK